MSPAFGTQPSPPSDMQLFSRRLSLSAGTFHVGNGERIVGPMRRGLKIAVILDGHQMLALDDRPAVMIDGPALVVTVSRGEHRQERTGLCEGELRCALVQISADLVEAEFGGSLAPLLARSNRDGPGLWIRPADAHLQALALQMAECPILGEMRSLFLGGKALELAALAVDQLLGEGPARGPRLPARTLEQIHAARDLLVAAPQDPPSLQDLARMTGLNPTKLTEGFRRVFGTSVFAYLQEHRLQQAYELIRSGRMGVAEAAFHVGYAPAHFSVLFRKRFGLRPSALR